MTTVADDQGARGRVEVYLSRTGLAARGGRVVPLTGDASDRRYYRLLVPDMPTRVLAVYPGPFDYATLTFVNVGELLLRMPLPVPAILAHEDDLGVLVQEDLGDVTLQAHLGAAPLADHAALYRQAVSFIAVIQQRGRDLASSSYAPYQVAFDVEKLTWEMDFFLKHFLEAYRGARVGAAERAALRAELGAIVEELAAEPRVLCHRDYHSRNLMLKEGRLYIIDFQDARMGPDTYDLASLLRDPYVDIGERATEDLVAYFLALIGSAGREREYRQRLDVMSLQRLLKALGTYGYQASTRMNPVYIQYIPRTLRSVREILHRHPRFGRLQELLAAYAEEVR
jgi:aminoglycoside/choline kinase family phosphotransferase